MCCLLSPPAAFCLLPTGPNHVEEEEEKSQESFVAAGFYLSSLQHLYSCKTYHIYLSIYLSSFFFVWFFCTDRFPSSVHLKVKSMTWPTQPNPICHTQTHRTVLDVFFFFFKKTAYFFFCHLHLSNLTSMDLLIGAAEEAICVLMTPQRVKRLRASRGY